MSLAQQSNAPGYQLKVFSGRANPELARRICDCLGIEPGRITMDNFADGEIACKIEEDVRGRDVFIIQPTCPPVNDSLMELLIMIDSFKRASAERITAVIPYFGYARQDRKDEGRVPISAKLVANMITRAGANRVLAMDLHAEQIQGFFDIPVDHLYAAPVIDDHFLATLSLREEDFVVVSPDQGSIKRVLKHARRLGGQLAIVDKRRSGSVTRPANLIGAPIKDKVALILDDMISTASSIAGAAEIVHQSGAKEIYLAATHGVFCGPALEMLRTCPAKGVIVTDTIPLPRQGGDSQTSKITVLSVDRLLADAISRIHFNQSVSALFRETRAIREGDA
jgi:ribose-phosphate pyrophosphokinase